MYRKLLEDRKRQDQSDSLKRSGRTDQAQMSNTGKKYEKANHQFKTHFDEIQQLVDNDHHIGSPTNQTTHHQVPVSERKKYQHHRKNILGSSSVLGNQNNASGGGMATTTITTAVQSTSAISPFPEKQKYQVSSNYQIAIEDGSSKYAPVSHSSVSVLAPLRKDIAGQSADTRSAQLETNMSMQQLSRIERTSQKQLNSISKLQNKLVKTTNKHMVQSGTGNYRYEGAAVNDYIANDGQSKALTAKDSSVLFARTPKRVQITDKKFPQNKINSSSAISVSTSNYQSAHPQQQPGNMNNSSANRSILKQNLNVNISSMQSQKRVNNLSGLKQQQQQQQLAISDRINLHKHSSSQAFKTPLKKRNFNDLSKVSKTPMMAAKESSEKFNGRKTMSVFQSQKRDKNKSILQGKNGNEPFGMNNSDLPMNLSQTRFRSSQQRQKRFSSVAETAQEKLQKQQKRDQQQQLNTQEDEKSGMPSILAVEKISSDSYEINGELVQKEGIRPKLKVKELDFGQIQAGQQSLELIDLSSHSRAVSHFQGLKMQTQMDGQSDANYFTEEQRQEVTDIIDKLDLQQAIKTKARAYFSKEAVRRASQNTSPRKTQKFNDQEAHMFKTSFNFTSSSKSKLYKGQDLQIEGAEEDDEELLQSVYNERQIGSQSEIQDQLKNILALKNKRVADQRDQQDTMRNTVTMGTSMGGSTIQNDPIDIQQNEQAFYHETTHQRQPSQLSGEQEGNLTRRNSKLGSLPSLKKQSENHQRNSSQQASQQVQFAPQKLDLLQISTHYKKQKKEKLNQTKYNRRTTPQRNPLSSIKRDYCPLILGQFKYGLNQKAPRSKDPNASEIMRFSQMACYRFAESNAPFMQLYEDQLIQLRKARRFLAREINKSPEGKKYAEDVLADSTMMKKMSNKLQLQIIEEAVNEQIQENLQRQSSGLKAIYEQHDKSRQQFGSSSIFTSNQTNPESKQSVTSGSSSLRRMRAKKNKQFDMLLTEQSVGSLDSLQQAQLSRGASSIIKNHNDIDINADFVSDATPRAKTKMKKATFEMDQFQADTMFNDQQLKMGLSLYYREQEFEQRRNFKNQQKQLMNYLNILFGHSTNSDDYKTMAKNLTTKLKRQNTDDSVANRRAHEIQREQVAGLDIDEDNINTEIIGLLAEEILRKTDFFDLIKGKQGSIQHIQQSQKERLEQKEALEPTSFLINDKTKLFNRVADNMKKGSSDAGLQSERSNSQVSQLASQRHTFNRLESVLIDEQRQKDSYLKQVVVGSHHQQPKFEGEIATLEDVHGEMAKTSFISECEKNLVVTVPLLLKIKDKKCILERYQLNSGLCQALSMSFTQFPDIATEFYFDANNLTDDDFATMLNGMSQLNYISRIQYNNNQFGPKSLQAIMPILCREQVKHSLRILHLKHCKITAQVTHDLLKVLNSHKNHMQSLTLVNVNLNQYNYKELCLFIKNSRHIKELDISWNGMRCHQMYEVVDAIQDNRTLQDLNLGYNNMHDSMQDKYAGANPTEKLKNMMLKQKLEAKMKKAKTQAARIAAERECMVNSMQQILKLIKFIKMNTNLMHLNLSGMGLTQQMMTEFGRAMRRTKSMVSLHLSSNNGDNAELRLALIERAHIKPFETIFKPDFKQKNNLEYKSNEVRSKFQLENSIKIGEREDEMQRQAQGKSKTSEQLNLKQMLKNKRGNINRVQVENNANEMLVFTRYLGHKVEMPGSGQWRMISTANDSQERCWVCNLEVYSLIFWSRDFGLKTQQELKNMGIDEMAYENQLYELEQRNQKLGIQVDYYKDANNPQHYKEGHDLIGFPQIFGEFNNWIPQRMYTIEELCYLIDQNKPDILKNLKKGNFVNQMAESVKDLNVTERALYDDHMNGVMSKYSKIKNWRKLLGSNLRYKRPFLANSEAIALENNDINLVKLSEQLCPSDSESDYNMSNSYGEEGEESEEYADWRRGSGISSDNYGNQRQRQVGSQQKNKAKKVDRDKQLFLRQLKQKRRMNKQLYVIPCFLQPGKQDFIINSQIYDDDDENLNESHELIDIDDLQERYFFHNMVVPQRTEKVPLFVKRLVKKENEEVKFDRNQTCFKDWKPPTDKDLQKMIDHDKELWKLPRFIKDEKQLEEVIDVFRLNIRKLWYIYITMSASSNFPGITWLFFTKFTETCHVIEKHIQSSDVDRFFLASAGDMAQIGCFRYQFFEAIMRVADLKYFKSGQAKTYAQAFQMLLDKNCFHYGPVNEWQEFRDDIWWTYETHRVIEANKFALQKIYKSYFAPRKKHFSKLDAIDMLVRMCKVIPDENKVIYCYGMSKMHVVQETTNKNLYDEMKYVEFLEFMGRCAYAKFKEFEDEPMERKLEMFLDEVFPAFSQTRNDVENEEEELSDSDPDY